MEQNTTKEVFNRQIAKKALDLLLNAGIKSIEDLDSIDYTIKDYEEEFGCNLKEYQKMVNELREGYWEIEEKMEIQDSLHKYLR